ncbi:MAG: response regulator [Oscillatoriales cyanobacterium]|uniref:Adenylate/guanylate cyclase domain-containing protein n=1 Tax=Microcoleus anatoxicus PTRS2 TaxID=2705321 RepID=A0ABU8YLD8_9CYAN|nr:MAG: response regulator [Oscillatoriales cyanobacterium]TAD93734.1 MAG: response regulator [Oscillatoriales cyanobacterium]TAE02277.1 MAG: response regulator [Oscillatoriales cyanobacterium]TAE99371.1 MAG: response regulator [Oscillatoriales cyanobacterium]TAF69868.1 MAG: response regulator [Oscillatoriales cyanobacterium]
MMNDHPLPVTTKDIMIVDDMPDNLRLLSTMLTSHGYQVRKAINGQLALQGAQMSPPSLILLDINMPKMNGYEVCQKLKKNDNTKDIPIIFISALDDVLEKVKAFQVGGADYITKPFQIEEVLARVESQLSLRSLQSKLQQQARELQERNALLEQEITERKRAEEEIRFLLETTRAIGESVDFNSALEVILHQVGETIGWDLGEAWIPDSEGTLLKSSRGWYGRDSSMAIFRQQSENLTFARNIGLPGRVWVSGKPEWVEDVSVGYPEFMRTKIALEIGFKAGFGVPILVGDEVLAVLVFFKLVSGPKDSRFIDIFNIVCTQLGSLIQRKKAEESLKIAEERYHSIVENAMEGIFQSTPSGQFISANPALAKLYGYESPTELMSSIQNISEQLYIDAERRREFVVAMDEHNALSGFESRVKRKDGAWIWVSENVRAVRNSQGKLIYYEGTVSDITERKLVQEALKFQQDQTEKLLLNILPKPIAERLKVEQSTIADSFEEVSVLFADIVGFTELSARMSPTELVKRLNVIFSQFDQLAEEYGVEKIKTIGDAYMVVGGLPTPRDDHAEAIAEMALEMQAKIAKLSAQTGEDLAIRVGINSGPVVAGVIGVSKFTYDLWGDTVNVAARMEVTGVAGSIQVTDVTYELLKDKYLFKNRGLTPIKGKGDMVTYWLQGRK